jgi:hypothetical protein
VPKLDEKISRLDSYEKWREPQKIDFLALVGAVLYEEHWGNWKELLQLMDKAQKLALTVREAAAKALANAGAPSDVSRQQ